MKKRYLTVLNYMSHMDKLIPLIWISGDYCLREVDDSPPCPEYEYHGFKQRIPGR